MEKEVLDNYMLAGRIASQARDRSARLIEAGASISEIIETTEAYIKDQGAEPACPTTISIDDIAAHSTTLPGDTRTIGGKDIVKLDLTAMVDGYIADTATTVCLDSSYEPMNDAVKAALDKALDLATPGRKLSELGGAIEDEIRSRGYNPVVNLSGHLLSRYSLHSGLTVPNIRTDTKEVLEEGMALAIEPFATDGAGSIKEIGKVQIYSHISDRPVRLNAARKILSLSKNRFRSLPFTPRWIEGLNKNMAEVALRQLSSVNALHMYPELKEIAGGMVCQAEHTVIVSDKPIVTTRSRT